MGKKIYRYAVRINDQWQPLRLSGRIVHVGRPPGAGPAGDDHVELWAEHTGDGDARVRQFRVYGTGHPINEPCTHVGTAFGAGGELVWHLMERDA